MKQYVLALDQGTTSSRSILFDHDGNICSSKQLEFTQIFPAPGLVEHDPMEIWLTQLTTAKLAMSAIGAQAQNIVAIGIANQRETTIVWNTETGIPVYNAIVWQDRRTSDMIDLLKQQGHADLFRRKTGLILDAYFSGTKLKWILDNVAGVRELAAEGKLAFGTSDSWLTWNLTNRREHVTDESNASRTLLFNIHTGKWDEELLKILDIPANILPRVVPSSGVIGEASSGLFGIRVPIAGIAGDQQAATFGNLCIRPGMVKNTYGTGCFLLKNTGTKALESKNNLLTTIGWNVNGERNYCLEGSVFIAGAAVQWVRDGLKFIDEAAEIEELANHVKDNGGVYMVPAFAGLGAPHWDQYARGIIVGITRGTSQAHIARATLESIAFQVSDVVQAMKSDSGIGLTALRVDGGACKNNFLMQFQADILDCVVERPTCLELTALGAAYLAGLAVGFWKSTDELEQVWKVDRIFEPKMDATTRNDLLEHWHKAVSRSQGWAKE
ncbi:MAG TPA: glycerol kinase [Neisseriales bacterium]|jgi:glycerol kinase|nr:glycerol kinase GlpK [Burkholderiales bacterium]MBP9769426.1 glycerol kinase GlpK [Burkholderiales bacterium]HCY38677.1 glycerol kinase [Neisseriales bacterium]